MKVQPPAFCCRNPGIGFIKSHQALRTDISIALTKEKNERFFSFFLWPIMFLIFFFVPSLAVYLSGNHFKLSNHPPKALLNPTFLVWLLIQYCVSCLWSLWSVHIGGWTCSGAQTGGFLCTNPFKAGTGELKRTMRRGGVHFPFLTPTLSALSLFKHSC